MYICILPTDNYYVVYLHTQTKGEGGRETHKEREAVIERNRDRERVVN